MKKITKKITLLLVLTVFLTMFMCIGTVKKSYSATIHPTVYLDGRQLSFDLQPIVENGRILVPMRTIFEAMGATVTWDESTYTATAIKGNTNVIIQIGSLTPTVNGQVREIDVPAKIINGRTLAPLRFVGEAFGGNVQWDPNTQTITIQSSLSVNNIILEQQVIAYADAFIQMNEIILYAIDTVLKAFDVMELGGNPSSELLEVVNIIDNAAANFNSVPVPEYFKESSIALNSDIYNMKKAITEYALASNYAASGRYDDAVYHLDMGGRYREKINEDYLFQTFDKGMTYYKLN